MVSELVTEHNNKNLISKVLYFRKRTDNTDDVRRRLNPYLKRVRIYCLSSSHKGKPTRLVDPKSPVGGLTEDRRTHGVKIDLHLFIKHKKKES